MKEFDNINNIIANIKSLFINDSGSLDFIFTHRNRNIVTIMNVIRGVPGFLMKVTDENSPDLAFESNWSMTTQQNKTTFQEVGWDSVFRGMSKKTEKHYLAQIFTNIRRVREISVFDYGFEVRSADNMGLYGIRSACLQDGSMNYIQSIVGEPFKGLKFREDVGLETNATWRHQGDSFMDAFKKQLLSKKDTDNINVGQSTKQLLIEDDDF